MAVAMGRLPATADESPVHFVPAAGDNTDFHVLSRFADVFRAVRDTRRSRRLRALP